MNKNLILVINSLLLLIFIPFLILFFFNHPTPEDFFWGGATIDNGYLAAQKLFYSTWSGRYFSYSILSVNPLLFKSIIGYKIFLLGFFIVFFATVFFFISTFTKSILTFREKILLLFSFMFLYFYSMQSVSEGFYWLTAVMIYPLGIMMILLFLIFYKKLSETDNKKLKILYFSVALFSIIAAVGTSEINSFLIVCLNVFILMKNIRLKNSLFKISIIFTLTALFFIILSYLSPGNFLRASAFEKSHNFMQSFEMSVILTFRHFFNWIVFSPLLIITLLLSPVFLKILNGYYENKEIKITNSLYLSVFIKYLSLYLIVFVIIFFTIWNTGEMPYGRTLNTAFVVFLSGWFYICFYILHQFKSRINFNFFKITQKYVYVIFILILSVLMFKKNNIRTAYSDVLKGTAYNYNQRLNQRYQNILEDKSENSQVDSILIIPKSFFLYDITNDPDNYYNKWYSQYFNKKTIMLK